MKKLNHGINFAPELTGIGKYTGELAAWLAARGHEVRVVTAPPYYPAMAVSPGFANAYRTAPMPDASGVQVLRCPLWVPTQPGGAKRLVHLASFALSSFPVMLGQIFWRPQVVWVVEPALFCAPAAVALARLSGAKAWLQVQDFEVDVAFDLGLLNFKLGGHRIRRLVSTVELWLMRRFDVVSTISERMHQNLLAKGVDAAKAKLAINWVDMAQFALTSSASVAAYRAELNIPEGAVVALYSGNMGGKQGLEVLAEVAKLSADDAANPIVFVFCGTGAGRADLLARCAGLSNVRFLDLQPAHRLPNLLATADIHLLLQRADAADLVMPSKLTGMLASARAVVATSKAGTELATVVQTCGLVVPPEDPLAFTSALRTLAADPELRKRFGTAGYLYALAHLDKDTVLLKFETDLKALADLPAQTK